MKKCLMLLMLCGMLAGTMLTGCTSAESIDEHARRIWLTTDLQARNMVEDWDLFWLYERNDRANRWYTRIGY